MLKINQVFTPRSTEVNEKMYVPRLDLERRLYRSINGTLHTLIFGNSGNGKSWLYKKVFSEKKVDYVTINCASANRKKSLTEEITSTCIIPGKLKKVNVKESKEAGANALMIGAKISSTSDFKIQQEDAIFEAFTALSKKQKSQFTVIVFDNLESIFKSEDLMEELANLIMLLDDSKYQKFKIKFLIVGVPGGVLDYFTKTSNLSTIGNRIEELPRVSELNSSGVLKFVSDGFNDLLGYGLSKDELEKISEHLVLVTMCAAQRMHEYCEKLSFLIEEKMRRTLHPDTLDTILSNADDEWLSSSLRECYAVMQHHFEVDTEAHEKNNQVLYAISRTTTLLFDSEQIAKIISHNFSKNSTLDKVAISKLLNKFTDGELPILIKPSNNNEYKFFDSKYIMCLRICLAIESDRRTVSKRQFKH